MGDHHIWMHEGTEQFMSVDAIYWHQSYDYTTLDYDIMLMKLAHKVEINDNVKPIALPKVCPNAGDMCTVSGWGNIYSDEGEQLLNISTTAKKKKKVFFLDKTNLLQVPIAFCCFPVAISEQMESIRTKQQVNNDLVIFLIQVNCNINSDKEDANENMKSVSHFWTHAKQKLQMNLLFQKCLWPLCPRQQWKNVVNCVLSKN